MGTQFHARRTLAGFFGLAAVIVVLFGVIALVALQPRDGLAWVNVPQLGPDLGLDAGLRTKPLKETVVADAARDRAIEGQGSLSVTAVMSAAPKGDPLTALAPTNRPVALAPTAPAAAATQQAAPPGPHRSRRGRHPRPDADRGAVTRTYARPDPGTNRSTYTRTYAHPGTDADAHPGTHADAHPGSPAATHAGTHADPHANAHAGTHANTHPGTHADA